MSEALQEVIRAIETGADWPPTDDLWKRLGLGEGFMVQRAYGGSLDAAQNLHNALLPAYRFRVEDFWAEVWWGPSGPFVGTVESDPNPARAWLLAILRAHLALTAQKEGR